MKTDKNIDDLYRDGMYEFLNDNFDKSIELLSEAADLAPERTLTFVSRGSAYMKQKRLDLALADFDHAIEIDPDYARAYHLRGLVKEQQEDDSGAMKDFDRAIEIYPQYGAAYHSRATLHTKMGNEDQAIEDIAMVQHLSNKNIETFANENNVWRSQHLRVESALETDLGR